MDHHVEPMHDLNQQPQHLHSGKSGHKKSSNKKLLIIIGVIAVLVVLAIGAFFLLKKDTKEDNHAQQNSSSEQQPEDTEPTMPPAEAAQLQTYKSTALNIEISHRKDWTVTEDADKKLLTLTSPKFTFQAGSESRKDVFTVKIGFGASEEAQQNLGSATVARDSLLIAYDAPTESQRFYTNVSYAGPPGEASFFEFFIVTGSVALQAGNPFGNSIIIGDSDFMIRGGFGADQENQLNYQQVPAAELEQYSAYEQAINIVKSLKVY